MFLIITEWNEPFVAEKLTESIRQGLDDGVLDVYEIQENEVKQVTCDDERRDIEEWEDGK